jgi:Tol biopolymer transport system component
MGARRSAPLIRTSWRRVAAALLPAAGCAIAVACSDAAPTAVPPVQAIAPSVDIAAAARPAQSLIAYVSGRAGVTDLYIMDVANGRSHAITRDRATASGPVWSPDGSKIAFASNRDALGVNIWVVAASGSTPTKLTRDGGTAPDWSSDGAKILFTTFRSNTTDIWVMNADGTGQTAVTTTTDAWENEPVWSHDRSKIAYTATRDGSTQIWVMNADGSSPVQLTGLTDTGWSFSPAWSPDGTQIAFASWRDSRQDLYIMNADGTGLTRITTDGPTEARPRWSTQGILFDAHSSGTPSVFFINPDGTGLTQLTRGSSWSYNGAWQPRP